MIYEITWVSYYFAGPHHLPLMSSEARAQWAHNSVVLNLLIIFYVHLFVQLCKTCQLADKIFPENFINATTQVHIKEDTLFEGIIGQRKPLVNPPRLHRPPGYHFSILVHLGG